MAVDFKKYDNAIAFRRALEDRLKNIAREQPIPLDRLRRRITFDRFLARLFETNKQNQESAGWNPSKVRDWRYPASNSIHYIPGAFRFC